MPSGTGSLDGRVSFTFTGRFVSCLPPSSVPIKAFKECINADGTTTVELHLDLDSQNVPLAVLESLVEDNYERIRDLVHRSHKSSAKAINTVTQRYTNRAVHSIFKRENSFTETEPSDLEITIPPSPKKSKRKRLVPAADSVAGPSVGGKRVKVEHGLRTV